MGRCSPHGRHEMNWQEKHSFATVIGSPDTPSQPPCLRLGLYSRLKFLGRNSENSSKYSNLTNFLWSPSSASLSETL